MSVPLTPEIIELLQDSNTVKILTTVDGDGVPHTVFKGSLRADESGNLQVLELIESSRTNRNLVRSIWYNRPVSVFIKGKDSRCFQIKGVPVKAHVSGPEFQKHYVAIRERLGDVDLAGVWLIRPDEIIDETPKVRRAEEEAAHPVFVHLDRLVSN